jgi:alkylhydroperoxidase family enzyme
VVFVSEPRIAPLPVDEWDDDVLGALRQAFPEAVVDRFRAEGAPTAITTMLHHPPLAGSWLAYNNVLLWGTPALEHRLRELMVLRVAHLTGSPYEWEQHVKLSERYGVTPADIAAVKTGPESETFTPLERDLLAATDQLIDGYRIAEDTWQRLAAQLDERQLIEAIFVVGTYTCLAMAFNTFGLRNDDG